MTDRGGGRESVRSDGWTSRFLANVQAGAATQEIENPGPLFW